MSGEKIIEGEIIAEEDGTTWADVAVVAAVQQGIPVFPVGPDKVPLTRHGFKDATTDLEQIREWERELRPWGWGLPTGAASGVDVLDGDGAEGMATLEELRLVETACHVITPSGGGHVYIRHTDGKTKNSTKFDGERFPGLDVRGEGGYVVAFAPGYAWSVSEFEPVGFDALPERIQYAIQHGKSAYAKKYGRPKKRGRSSLPSRSSGSTRSGSS